MGAAVSLGSFSLLACPAAAQTAEEITVYGQYGPGAQPQRLSQAVTYADLDLSKPADQTELKHRMRLTARYLCGRLGVRRGAQPV